MDIFNSILEFIKTITDFISTLWGYLVGVYEMMCPFLFKIPTLFAWLPTEIVAIIVLGFGVVVVYKFLGREG